MNLKPILELCVVLSILIVPVLAADLQMPSPVRGWNTAPEEARVWGQSLLDWAAMAAILVGLGCLIYFFIIGRVADTSGSVQSRNNATEKTIGTILSIILLVVSLAFIWFIFMK